MREMIDGRFLEERDISKRMLVDEREVTKKMFVDEREVTQAAIKSSAQDVKQFISSKFMSFIEDNFTPAIDSLREQISDVRRDMKKMRVVVD